MNKKTRTRLMVFMLIPILLFTAIFAILCTTIIFPKPATAMGLGLDPENDPTVFTTTSGLEIKKSNGLISAQTATTTNSNSSFTQNLNGFYYFTMGTYSGTFYTAQNQTDTMTVTNQSINWIILGRGDTLGLDLNQDTGEAGEAIRDDTQAALREFYGDLPTSVKYNSEIPAGCVLVISEKLLGNAYFNSAGALNYGWESLNSSPWYSHTTSGSRMYGSRYRYIGSSHITSYYSSTQTWNTSSNAGGSLYNAVNNLLSINPSTGQIVSGKNAVNFSQEQAKYIRPQTLKTYYHTGSAAAKETFSTDGGTYYTMFPLASKTINSDATQNFLVETYLTTTNQRTACYIGTTMSDEWWLRSGYSASQASVALASGGIMNAHHVWAVCGVRPAFVMEFTPNLI